MKKIISCLFLASVIGCTSLSPMSNQAPKTYNQHLVEAYSTMAEIRSAATILLTNGAIKVSDAQKIEDSLENARHAVDDLAIIHNSGGTVNFDAITAILISIQNELNTKGANK